MVKGATVLNGVYRPDGLETAAGRADLTGGLLATVIPLPSSIYFVAIVTLLVVPLDRFLMESRVELS